MQAQQKTRARLIIAIIWIGLVMGLIAHHYWRQFTRHCFTTSLSFCLGLKKVELLDWHQTYQVRATRQQRSIGLKLPYNGHVVISPHTHLNFDHRHLGDLTSISLYDQAYVLQGKIYLHTAQPLLGPMSQMFDVEPNQIFARAELTAIDFLDNYSLIMVSD